jgi:hypothetical protein
MRTSCDRDRILALLVCLVSACNGRTDDATLRRDSVGVSAQAVVRRAVPTSVVVDSAISTESGAAASGPVYEAMIVSRVLPDEPMTAAITLAPNDTADITNYQAEAWWLGRDDRSPRERWRFSADFERYASGALVLKLDTLIVRDRQQPPFHTAKADSIAVRGLRPLERFATRCRVIAHRTDDRLLGLLSDSTSERWRTPRLAWFVDTMASRFRRVKPDSLACWLAGNPD